MKTRAFWSAVVENAWQSRSVIWLAGVRRAGKTSLCLGLSDVEYFDFELPSARRAAGDPESFLSGLRGKRVVLDEIHRLPNPSELLKIAADHFPDVKVIATGSSSLVASSKFRDTLTGRKTQIWLTPMIQSDMEDFGNAALDHRLVLGGLPPFFLQDVPPEREYQEWLEDYWAKDVERLFRLERRDSFERFFELVMAQSGGIFEAARFARDCEVGRTAIRNYLRALEATFVVQVVRPFSRRKATEIVSAPKVYGFDTGFVCCHRGWKELRPEDKGILWEHFVLNEIQGRIQTRKIHYWRDKLGHEVDFVLLRPGQSPVAVECKSRADDFEAKNFSAFHRLHGPAHFFLVAPDVDRTFQRKSGDMTVHFVSLEGLIARILSGVEGGEVQKRRP